MSDVYFKACREWYSNSINRPTCQHNNNIPLHIVNLLPFQRLFVLSIFPQICTPIKTSLQEYISHKILLWCKLWERSFNNFKGAYTLQKIFHGTENFPRTSCAVRFFLKKKSYCACGPRKIFRSVENFLKCICTITVHPLWNIHFLALFWGGISIRLSEWWGDVYTDNKEISNSIPLIKMFNSW